jgi:hypothetical protein
VSRYSRRRTRSHRRHSHWTRRRCGRGRRCGRFYRRSSSGPRLRLARGRLRLFRRRFRGSEPVEMLSRQFGVLEIERTRVRLLLGDADFRQKVDEHLGLDLKFTGQLIYSNLIGIWH